jgi:hypothetical protein
MDKHFGFARGGQHFSGEKIMGAGGIPNLSPIEDGGSGLFNGTTDSLHAIASLLASFIPAGFTLQESAQSGNKVMTNAYVVEYLKSNAIPWIFCGGNIDLSSMQAGDTITIRIRTRQVVAGPLIILTQTTYNDVAPVTHPLVKLPVLANLYGVEISMIQTAGPFRTIPCEFFESL